MDETTSAITPDEVKSLADRSGAKRPDPFALTDEAVERSLLTGQNKSLLEDYFGPAQLEELQRLVQETRKRSLSRAERVLILPGIMGSRLGYKGLTALFDDVLWLDPIDIAAGRLRDLDLERGDKEVRAVGVLLFAYLALKFRLQAAGYDASFHPYDWRHSVHPLGKELAGLIEQSARPVHLVCHSMGGLLARATLGSKPKKLGRVVTLGTPHFGSLAPVQAFRGVDPAVRKIARLDLVNDRAALARIFGTFEGLCEMLPAPELAASDYFDLATWPTSGGKPGQAMLERARKAQAGLPRDGRHLVQIVGVDRETVVGARVVDDEFVYTISTEGDGTVPLALARLPDTRTYFIEETHGSLANSATIAKAVSSILATGETRVLPESWTPTRFARTREVSETQLRAEVESDGTAGLLGIRDHRELVAEYAAPARVETPTSPEPSVLLPQIGSASPTLSDRIVVGRRRQRRIDVTIVHGDILDVEADAYVLGVFRNVRPTGAASAINARLDGAIDNLIARRMFNAGVGETTILPTGRHPVRPDFIAFAGLGPFDSFGPSVLEVAGENLMRSFLSARIDDFATVPIGGTIGGVRTEDVGALLRGFFKALADVDGEHRFRGFTICEIDETNFEAIHRAILELATTDLFGDVEITLQARHVPRTAAAGDGILRDKGTAAPEPVYLIVRQEDEDRSSLSFSVSALTAGTKAAIHRDFRDVDRAALEEMLAEIATAPEGRMDPSAVAAFGERLGRLVLPDTVREVLDAMRQHPLVVVHDAGASRIPWETLTIEGHSFASAAGMSHRYEADNLSVAKWLERRRDDETLKMLLVVNPTEDLKGADAEGQRVLDHVRPLGIEVRHLKGKQARRSELLDCFRSGEFDVVHYAGHAYFEPADPSRSGILCHGGEVLSGADLANIGNLPSLVFFNACEAARVRRKPTAKVTAERVRRAISFAEAFLRGGVANYLGTYWPVGDGAAENFAVQLYTDLLAGAPLGRAVIAGRTRIAQTVDWANYVLYGQPDFQLRLPSGGRGSPRMANA